MTECVLGPLCRVPPEERHLNKMKQCKSCSHYFHDVCAAPWTNEPFDCGCARRCDNAEMPANKRPRLEVGALAEFDLPASARELGEEMETISALAMEGTRRKELSENSRSSYISCLGKMLHWMWRYRRDILTDEFQEGLEFTAEGLPIVKSIHKLLDDNVFPIKVDRFRADDFIDFIVDSLKTQPDIQLSTYNSMRSALKHIYRESDSMSYYGRIEPMISNFYRKLQGLTTDNPNAGELGVVKRKSAGKEPMPFTLYKVLCEQLLLCKTLDMLFTRTFLIVSWNLSYQAVEVDEIKYDQLSWQDELMCIECRHLKNQDQSNQARDSYRICANPLMPEICPFLALGIYFLSYTPDEQKLFPGSHQYHRFLAGLQRVLTPDESSSGHGASRSDKSLLMVQKEVSAVLKRLGLEPKDMGSYSIKKGSLLHHGGFHTKHVLFPPRFTVEDEQVETAIQLCFPTLPAGMKKIAQQCLASVVYHEPFLKRSLNDNHPLWSSLVFLDVKIYESLKGRVTCSVPDGSMLMEALGTPHPIVQSVFNQKIIEELRELKKELKEVKEEMQYWKRQAIAPCPTVNLHEDGEVSQTSSTLASAAEQGAGPAEAAPSPGAQVAMREKKTLKVVNESGKGSGKEGGGAAGAEWPMTFPDNMTLTDELSTPAQAWTLWFCGNRSKGYPPFRFLQPDGMAGKEQERRLSDLRFLVQTFDKFVQKEVEEIEDAEKKAAEKEKLDLFKKSPTLERAKAIFMAHEERFYHWVNHDTKVNSRRGQLKWSTFVRKIRKRRQQEKISDPAEQPSEPSAAEPNKPTEQVN